MEHDTIHIKVLPEPRARGRMREARRLGAPRIRVSCHHGTLRAQREIARPACADGANGGAYRAGLGRRMSAISCRLRRSLVGTILLAALVPGPAGADAGAELCTELSHRLDDLIAAKGPDVRRPVPPDARLVAAERVTRSLRPLVRERKQHPPGVAVKLLSPVHEALQSLHHAASLLAETLGRSDAPVRTFDQAIEVVRKAEVASTELHYFTLCTMYDAPPR